MAELLKRTRNELLSLADEADLKINSGAKKADIVESINEALETNASKLSSNPIFDFYYGESEAKPKPRARRQTQVRPPADVEPETSPERGASTGLATRTPKAQRTAARVPLPASPAQVTDLVERQRDRMTASVRSLWEQAGLTTYAESARESLSTVTGIQVLLLAFEMYGLQRAVLPWRDAFSVPALNIRDPFRVTLPDVFVLVTSAFWAPSSLWLSTSLFAPLIFSWFFNLTVNAKRSARYTVDPLVFSVAKAVTAWLVYGPPGYNAGGLVSGTTALRVNIAVPGGWFGIVIGSLIGMMASLYEVALRK